jgi:hypothetical protein
MNGALAWIDPGNGEIHVVGKPAAPGQIAFAQGRVYLGGTMAIRRINGLTLPPAN